MLANQVTNPQYKGFRAAHVVARPTRSVNTHRDRPVPYPQIHGAWFCRPPTPSPCTGADAQGKRLVQRACSKLDFNVVQSTCS